VNKLQNHISEGSKPIIYTDEYRMYSKLESAGYKHEMIDHSIKYVNGNVHINNCENRHSLLRIFLQIRRGVSKHNLQSYVNLFQFFFNIKLITHNPLEIVSQVINAIVIFLHFLQHFKNYNFLKIFT